MYNQICAPPKKLLAYFNLLLKLLAYFNLLLNLILSLTSYIILLKKEKKKNFLCAFAKT